MLFPLPCTTSCITTAVCRQPQIFCSTSYVLSKGRRLLALSAFSTVVWSSTVGAERRNQKRRHGHHGDCILCAKSCRKRLIFWRFRVRWTAFAVAVHSCCSMSKLGSCMSGMAPSQPATPDNGPNTSPRCLKKGKSGRPCKKTMRITVKNCKLTKIIPSWVIRTSLSQFTCPLCVRSWHWYKNWKLFKKNALGFKQCVICNNSCYMYQYK